MNVTFQSVGQGLPAIRHNATLRPARPAPLNTAPPTGQGAQPRFRGIDFSPIENLTNAVFWGFMGLAGVYIAACIGGAVLDARMNKKTRPADTLGTITTLIDSKEAAIVPDGRVFIRGELAGTYNEAGEAFAPNGTKMGHADEDGKIYGTYSDKPIAWFDGWGNITLPENPEHKAFFASVNAPELSRQEQGAVGLILYKTVFP
jgi:hypothetical protein